MAKINGESVTIPKDTTILQYIEQNEFNLSYIVVECNGDILPKSQYGQRIIDKEDVIEIVCFVGGG